METFSTPMWVTIYHASAEGDLFLPSSWYQRLSGATTAKELPYEVLSILSRGISLIPLYQVSLCSPTVHFFPPFFRRWEIVSNQFCFEMQR